MSVIRYTNTIKAIWEKYLRVLFSSDTTPIEYRYTPNEKTSRIRIYKEQPLRVYNLPMITISTGSGDASLRYLGNEVVKDVNNVYNECVQNNKLTYVPIKDSVVGTFSINPLTGAKTVYVVGTHFSVDWNTGKISWDKGIAEPEIYYMTYATFESNCTATTVYNEYKVKYEIIPLISFSKVAPTGKIIEGEKYFNTIDSKIYTYTNSAWVDNGEFPVLGTLYLDNSVDYMYEFTMSGMVRVYSYSGYPRLYLDYYEPVYEGFLVENIDEVVQGYTAGESSFNYTHQAYLENPSAQILEVYSYDENGNKLYYNRDEVYCAIGDRKLIWTIAEPERYFVSYISSKSLLSHSGKFVQSPLNVTVKFDVFARSSQDRERITDLLVLYIRHLIRPSILSYFTFSKEDVSGESQESLDNQTIYKNSVSVPCVTHYSHYIDNSTYALIKAIKLDVDMEE